VLEKNLALKLIGIGYKVLSIKLHPDKGGSHDAMRRLNRVRAKLKEAYE
jgi:curved DNA-binding protein CbpA